MTALNISDSWKPTPESINALPLPLRRYIRDLQTNVDPSEMLRENFRLRQENHALRNECQRLALRANVPPV
jgi:hypothetical protein